MFSILWVMGALLGVGKIKIISNGDRGQCPKSVVMVSHKNCGVTDLSSSRQMTHNQLLIAEYLTQGSDLSYPLTYTTPYSMSIPRAEMQTGTHFHIYGKSTWPKSCDKGGTGGQGGVGDQHGGEGGLGEGGQLFYGSQITNLNVYSHGQEPRHQGQIEPITQEQCHSALALVRYPLASQIFQGRREIFDKMQQYFSQEPKKRRIFVLHGLGGSGKTQVALKFLESINGFTKRFFVNASSPEALKTSFMNIAISQSFGKTPEAGFQWLISEDKEWTLLFDNADDPKLKLSPFFPQCTHGNIIITSRNPQLAAYGPASHSQVGDLDEENAVLLLLARAVKEQTDENHQLATDIVQAGAYIAKFKCLINYLLIYRKNKEELLQQHPDQAHDNYEWTVYTTWQISFEKLSPVAAHFLQLCALLHHSKIPESIFAKATEWIYLRNTVAEIEEYSLLERNETSNTLSMHPLVHLWCSGTQANRAAARGCMTNILGMAIALGSGGYLNMIGLMDHVKMLAPDVTMIDSRFQNEYGHNQLELERQQSSSGNDHPDTLSAMANLAVTYGQLGRYQEAEWLKLSVLEQCQKILGDDHPDTLRAMASLAATYVRLGWYQEAERLELSVLEQRQKILGDDHPDMLRAMADLAATYGQLGRYQEAEWLELSVLEQRQKILGAHHPDTLTAMANLDVTLHSTSSHQAAENLQLKVVAKHRDVLGAGHPDTLKATRDLKATQPALAKVKAPQNTGVVNWLSKLFSRFKFPSSKK
ncbi:P-loop containing nucleoside triphosphate hydrolase protein [Roridomyces roridus]|uniref:P-loop containing nucleoside triphosphate hydrolase protein n=1 Tax=Roridomyces roridus TaxID=1738132 RepID=A0AAD7C8U9_9AGAR|nr:P-loop containing nucleoside triphosphate hydrolase protein [Roridomyces roridus]